MGSACTWKLVEILFWAVFNFFLFIFNIFSDFWLKSRKKCLKKSVFWLKMSKKMYFDQLSSTSKSWLKYTTGILNLIVHNCFSEFLCLITNNYWRIIINITNILKWSMAVVNYGYPWFFLKSGIYHNERSGRVWWTKLMV